MGSVYKQKTSGYWWIQYYRNGKPHRESTKTTSLSFAKRLLRKREGEIAEGKFPGLRAYKTRVSDLVRLYLKDYKDNNRKSLKEVKRYADLIEKHFGNMLAANVTSEDILDYRANRKVSEVKDSTINRELAALRRMYNLARHQRPPLVTDNPVFKLIEDDNVRTGFFEQEDFDVLYAALPDHLKVVAAIGYYTGMRLGKVLHLQWKQIDWHHSMLRLEQGTKTKKVGHVPLIPQLTEILERWRMITVEKWPQSLWVCHYQGRRITRIYTAWRSACKRVGLEGKLFHDLRRTAARNLIRAGIPQAVVMEITGHKTISVFRPYDIVSDEDKKEAAVKYARYMKKKAKKSANHSKIDIHAHSEELAFSQVIDN